MADSLYKKVRTAKGAASKDSVAIAAAKYVKAGLNSLSLTPKQEYDLQQKLIPIIKNTIAAERGRTATRAMGVEARETKKAQKAANKKILGGK